jgi:hypothetical protein
MLGITQGFVILPIEVCVTGIEDAADVRSIVSVEEHHVIVIAAAYAGAIQQKIEQQEAGG